MGKLSEFLTVLVNKLNLSLKAEPQEFTEEQKKQLRNNMGVAKPDWNENDPDAAGYVQNRTHYYNVSNNIVMPLQTFDFTSDTISWGDIYEGDVEYDTPFYDLIHSSCDKFIFNYNGQDYELVKKDTYGDLLFGDTNFETAPFYLNVDRIYIQYYGETYYTFKLTKQSNTTESITLSVTEVKEDLKQLDEIFIPDTISRVDYVLNSIENRSKSNWLENDSTKAEYIVSRPGGYTVREYGDVVQKCTIHFTSSDTYTITGGTPGRIRELLEGDGPLTVTWNNVPYQFDKSTKQDVEGTNGESYSLYVGDIDVINYPFCIEFWTNWGADYGVRIKKSTDTPEDITLIMNGYGLVAKRFDQQYLPEIPAEKIASSIARITDLPIKDEEIDSLTALV